MAYGYAEYEAIKQLLYKYKIRLESKDYESFIKELAKILKI